MKLVGDYCAARCISSTYCEVLFGFRESCENRIDHLARNLIDFFSFPSFPDKVAPYFHRDPGPTALMLIRG